MLLSEPFTIEFRTMFFQPVFWLTAIKRSGLPAGFTGSDPLFTRAIDPCSVYSDGIATVFHRVPLAEKTI